MPAAEIIKPKITIKVVGVGGGGNNIVRCVHEKYDLDITLIGINSEYPAQAGYYGSAHRREADKWARYGRTG